MTAFSRQTDAPRQPSRPLMELILAPAVSASLAPGLAPEEPAPVPAAGVLRLPNDADPRALAAQGALAGVHRIELHFPKFTDGRAYSQAFLLRRRLGFGGDIRATGDVLVDQLQQMARSGFSSAVLRADQDLASAHRQLARFASTGFYQGDVLQRTPRLTAARLV